MVDSLQTNLQSYNLQLQQVEAALSIDPDNEELSKLKGDLEEVVNLTKDLIKQHLLENSKKDTSQDSTNSPAHTYNVGDACQALYSDDGQYHDAVIEDMNEDGEQITVKFKHNDEVEVTTVVLLRKAIKRPDKKKFLEEPLIQPHRRAPTQSQREYQKKKKLKKQQRYKQLEEEREVEKNKWLAFSTKKKSNLLKKSIFASPETVNGRVGIGTCGVSGLPMTEFSAAEKRRKGAS